METTELGAHDQEHTIERLGVLAERKERGVESEAEGNLGGCKVVGSCGERERDSENAGERDGGIILGMKREVEGRKSE